MLDLCCYKLVMIERAGLAVRQFSLGTLRVHGGHAHFWRPERQEVSLLNIAGEGIRKFAIKNLVCPEHDDHRCRADIANVMGPAWD